MERKDTQEIWPSLERTFYLQACRNKIHIGGLKGGASKAGKTGVQGLAPGKISHDPALLMVGKHPIFGQCAIEGNKGSRLMGDFSNFEALNSYDIKRYCIFDRYW